MSTEGELRAENKRLLDARDAVVLHCDAVLRGVRLQAPMWGPPIACELQMLLACEVKLEALGIAQPGRHVLDTWLHFVNQHKPAHPYSPAAERNLTPLELYELMNGFIEGPYAAMLRPEKP